MGRGWGGGGLGGGEGVNNEHFFSLKLWLQWLQHLWNHENMFETGVVRANEC